MPICGFEVGTSCFECRGDVPAPATLVGDEGEAVVVSGGDGGDEGGVAGDGVQAVGYC